MKKPGADRDGSTSGLGVVETCHGASLQGFRTYLSMFEVWMHGVVLCFAQSICLVRLAVVLWRDKMLLLHLLLHLLLVLFLVLLAAKAQLENHHLGETLVYGVHILNSGQ